MKTSINALHHQSSDWLRELQFYKDDILLLQTRLQEVAAKNTAQEVLAQVEHFQNKFILLLEQADILKHDVNLNNEAMLQKAEQVPTHIHEKSEAEATALFNGLKDYAQSLAEVRFNLNKFLSKVF